MANNNLSYEMIDLPLFIQIHMMKMQLERRLAWHPFEGMRKRVKDSRLQQKRLNQIEHKRARVMSEL